MTSQNKNYLLPIFLLAWFAAACAPGYTRAEQSIRSESLEVRSGTVIGQSFTARYDGLAGVEVFLRPLESGDGRVALTLAKETGRPTQTSPEIALSDLEQPGYIHFALPPDRDSAGRDFRAEVSTLGDGAAVVRAGPGPSYLNGSASVGGQPVDTQLAFRLLYHPGWMLLGLLQEALAATGVLAAAAFLLLPPGYAFLAAGWAQFHNQNLFARLVLAACVSLAFYPVLLLWSNLIRLELGRMYAWLPSLIALAYLLRRRLVGPADESGSRQAGLRDRLLHRAAAIFRVRPLLGRPDLPFLAFITLVVLLSAFVRIWPLRSLDVPMWGDSLQHTMITQLLVENGGLFQSWQPYAEMTSFTYHFGFHSAAALLHWLTAMPSQRAVLWMGQITNWLAVLALYPLTMRISGSRWAGAGALLLAGLLTEMPNFYINWGRYTQLAGQVILAAAILLAWELLSNRDAPARLGALTGLVFTGLALTHYRVALFGLSFIPVFWLFRVRGRSGLGAVRRSLLMLAFAFVLFLPWFINLFGGKLVALLAAYLKVPAASVPAVIQRYNAAEPLGAYLPWPIWILIGLSLLWGLWRRSGAIWMVAAWWALIVLFANPAWLGLPGAGILTNFAVGIAAYIPASILIGAAFGALLGPPGENRTIPNRPARSLLVSRWIALLGASLLGIASIGSRLAEVNPARHALVTRPDQRAFEWLEQHTPTTARFLVETRFAFGETSVVGTDAGWWIPILAGRGSMLPPLTYTSEQGPFSGYVAWINELPRQIQDQGLASAEVASMLAARRISHVYIGQRRGQVNNLRGPTLDVQALLESSDYELIYAQDRVRIFRLVERTE